MISNFNSGTTVTFPLYIYGAALRGIPVEVNVLATMLFGPRRGGDAVHHLAAAPGGADGGGRPEQEQEPPRSPRGRLALAARDLRDGA